MFGPETYMYSLTEPEFEKFALLKVFPFDEALNQKRENMNLRDFLKEKIRRCSSIEKQEAKAALFLLSAFTF